MDYETDSQGCNLSENNSERDNLNINSMMVGNLASSESTSVKILHPHEQIKPDESASMGLSKCSKRSYDVYLESGSNSDKKNSNNDLKTS